MKQAFDDAISALTKNVEIAAVTRSEKGAVIIADGKRVDIPAAPVSKVLDTTGAGDQFAAGFLYGFTEGKNIETCGKLGALAAAEVIQQIGPRPATALSSLIAKAA